MLLKYSDKQEAYQLRRNEKKGKAVLMRHTVREYLDILFSNGLVKSFILSSELMEKEICDLTFSTKNQQAGGIFICKGAAFKKEYLEKAVENGALLYVSESAYSVRIPAIIVNDVRSAMPLLADLFFDGALNSMISVGVTGTKGKTTTSFMVKSALDCYLSQNEDTKCALLSSVKIFDGKDEEPSLMTTPEAVEYQRIFARARDNGCKYIVSEVSSQGLKYQRCIPARYKVAVFTNITPDHISPNEHTDFEDYFESKLKIFDMCENALVFSGCDRFERVCDAARKSGVNLYTFGYRENDDFFVSDVKALDSSSVISVMGDEYTVPMPGSFNVTNALAAISVCKILEIPEQYIKEGLKDVRVDGRCEIFESRDKEICAVVDYAHNKESVNALIGLAKEYYPDKKICLLFGCPGGKAYNRREEIGTIAAGCDYVIVTEDDPAGEELSAICDEIVGYVKKGRADCRVISDREEAIGFALDNYRKHTVILIAGKGSERTQKRKNGPEEYLSDSYYVRKRLSRYEEEILSVKD